MSFDFPAVYRFISISNEIIYVGSAKILKRRMYSHKSNGHLPKECYDKISSIEYIRCSGHGDALKLEAELIDYYRPKYNKQLKRKDIDIKYDPKIDKLKWKTYEKIKPLDEDLIKESSRQDKILLAMAYALFIFVIIRCLF